MVFVLIMSRLALFVCFVVVGCFFFFGGGMFVNFFFHSSYSWFVSSRNDSRRLTGR